MALYYSILTKMTTQALPSFEAAFMAVERVGRLLRSATAALEEGGVPYAVIGGNAIAAWVATIDPGAIRFTKDVDILIRRADLTKAAQSLSTIGLEQVEVWGVTAFLEKADPRPSQGVRFLFAGERIKQSYAHPAPDLTQVQRSAEGHFIVDLVSLVAMKLQSFRPVDQTHIVDLKGVGLITEELAAQLPPDLRERLEQVPEPDTH